jgi:hypothetical protein
MTKLAYKWHFFHKNPILRMSQLPHFKRLSPHVAIGDKVGQHCSRPWVSKQAFRGPDVARQHSLWCPQTLSLGFLRIAEPSN